jgi:hypothetical protein
MTTGQDDALATPAPAPDLGPKPNPIQRVIGVLFSPDATMASIAKRPDWVLPLVLILISSFLVGIVIAQHVDFGAAVRDQVEQNKNLSQEQIDKAVKMGVIFGKVATYLAPVFGIIWLLVIAGVLLLAVRLFGGEGDYKQAFSVTCYASIPGIIKAVVLLIIVLARGGLIPAQALATAVRSNLGFLADFKANPMAFALLSSVDLFAIWFVVLLIIGFAYVSRLSKAKTAVIIVSLWIVATCFKLIGPALQSIRAGK